MSVQKTYGITSSELETCCMGLGHVCMVCKNKMPDENRSPRPCPYNSSDVIHGVARTLYENDAWE